MRKLNSFSYLRIYWKENSVVLFLLVLLCGLQVGANLLMMQAFQGIIDRNMDRFLYWTFLLVAVWFLIYGLTGLEIFFRCRVIRRMNNAIRQDITEILLQKSYWQFHQQSVGDYLTLFTNDINQIENLAWNPFYDCIRQTVTIILSIAALLTLHWSLLIASLITTAVMLPVPKLFHQRMESLGAECAREQAAAVNALKELLSGYDVLRFFNREKRFLQSAKLASDQMESPRFRLAYVKGYFGAGMGCINIICQMLHVTLIGFLSVRGLILTGALTGGGNLCANLSAGLGNITQDILSMSGSKPYFEKLSIQRDEPMDKIEMMRKKQRRNGENHTNTEFEMSAEIMQNGITMEHVTFGYDKEIILNNFCAHFVKGGKYALVGPSGCGKSTLLKLILGCLPEYTGSIRLGHREVKDCTSEQLWRQISYIEQDVFLFHTTVLDNITLGEDFTEEQIKKALRDSALNQDVSSMPDGLHTVVGENGSSLSGGQKQRVAIARALLHDRSILLVDEGTSALDRENAVRIENNLLSQPDLTLVLVSHHLSSEQKKKFSQVIHMR